MENTITNSSRIQGFITLYDLHTDYFVNALEGISDTDAHKRLNTKANHIAWLAGSMVQQRFELANSLDFSGNSNYKQPADDLFKDNRGIIDGAVYPTIAEYIEQWQHITPILRKCVAEADDEKLDTLYEMPGMQFSFYDIISFKTYREANCIGQIALWRRLLGYSAMKYM